MKAKISLSRLMVSTAIIAVGSACSPTLSFAADFELPTNPNVVGGASSVTTPLAGVMHVNQSTDRTVINWDSFNIGSDASVQFFQPDSNSLAVNRVMSAGTDPTRILGELKANGRIMVLDRNGVLFGSGSVVDVGGIVASTGDVTNASVMSGANVLTLSNFGTGTIENQGHITAADSGLVALVGPVVKNSGVIQANLGKVELAAGNETATIDLYGDGLISLAYTDKNDNLLAENTGTITAESGIIHMTAAAAKDVVDSVVNMDGIANATSATLVDGQIILTAKKVKVGNSASVTGPTQITAQTTELDSAINGAVSGASDTVNVLSDNAKIGQALDIVTDGGNIYVASGTYNEDLTINTANIKLYGAMAGIDGNDASRGVGESLLTPHSPGIVVNADGVTVDGFAITGADNGIEVLSADNVTLKNNVITFSTLNGIYVTGSNTVSINGNKIDGTDYDGIYALTNTGLNIAGNTILNSGLAGIPNERGNGILLSHTSGSTITGNDITGSLWDGIKAVFSDNLNVNNNTIYSVTRSGVSVENSANAVIDANTLTNLGMVGVWSEKNATATITNNYIDDAGSYFGIFHNYGDNATITGNTVTASDIYGFYIRNSSNLDISNNTIQNTGSDAALLDNVKGTVSFTNNSMSDFGLNGLRVVNVGTPSVYNITSNTIGNTGVTGNAGVYLDVGSGTLVNLVNNTIANNLRYGIEAYSGQLDLSSGINTIQNTDIGLGLYSTKGSSGPTLVGSTIGATHFIDQSSLFVDLGFDVMFAPGFPTQIDGMNAKYTLGGSTIEPSVLSYVTPAQYATLQTMIYDYNDSADRGLFFFPVSSLDPSTFFRTFSTDAATDGSGSLRITGLSLLALNAPTALPEAPLTAANLNDLTPAAGGDETGTFSDENITQIEPAAGGDEGTASGSPCWADANQALGQGQQVTFNFGGDANDLMNSAEACGNTL